MAATLGIRLPTSMREMLLAVEPEDLNLNDPKDLERAAQSLAQLLLRNASHSRFRRKLPLFLRRLDLCSISRLERLLGVNRHYLRALASRAGSCYSPFERGVKPKPFQRKPRSSKLRVIDNPSEELKVIQRLVNERLLRPLKLPEFICGGVRAKVS
jgi:hypothetical protein